MSTDPRRITIALESLEKQLLQWVCTSNEMLAVANQEQRQVQESADRAYHKANVLFDRANIDVASVEENSQAAQVSKEKTEDTFVKAKDTNKISLSLLQRAKATLAYCENELKKALAWLERAEARLARAIQQYNSAVASLRAAQANLASARSRLSACLADKQRK